MSSANCRQLRFKNFDFVAIALDDLANAALFWQPKGFDMACAVAGYAGMALMQDLGNPSGKLPYTVLLDENGAILKAHLGAPAADLTAILARAMGLPKWRSNHKLSIITENYSKIAAIKRKMQKW